MIDQVNCYFHCKYNCILNFQLVENRRAIDRVKAVAFTDSVHSLNYQTSGQTDVQEWFKKVFVFIIIMFFESMFLILLWKTDFHS